MKKGPSCEGRRDLLYSNISTGGFLHRNLICFGTADLYAEAGQLADEILSGETGSITQMSKDELLELFEGE